MKKLLSTIALMLVMVLTFTSCQVLFPGIDPDTAVVYINKDGYLVVNGVITDYYVEHEDEVSVSDDGYVIVNGNKTEYKVHTSDEISINSDGYIVVNGVVTEYRADKEDVIYVDADGYIVVNGVKTEYKTSAESSDDAPDDTPDDNTGDNTDDNTSTQDTIVIGVKDTLPDSFNPFYSKGSQYINITQLPLVAIGENGNVVYGEDEACVVLDLEKVTTYNPDGSVKETTYYFVLKNDLKYSNGSALTIRDVLFNLYVYLDPAYYGGTPLYAIDIKGLDEYRTQTKKENEQEAFDEIFYNLASERISRLRECLQDIYNENRGSSLSMEEMLTQLTAYVDEIQDFIPEYATVVDDYKLAEKFFREELKKDYTYSKGTAEDISFIDKNGNKVTLTTDTEAFLYNEGLITWNKNEYKFEYSLGSNSKNMSEEDAIDAIFSYYFPNNVDEIVTYWATANDLHTYFTFLEKQKYFEGIDDKIENISGIRYANRNESITVNGVEYGIPTLNADGSVAYGNEILAITVEVIDPTAIYNFAFNVAPMYYYSDEEQIALFDYESHFGVKYGNIEFQNSVINNLEKSAIPYGAGPYKAASNPDDPTNVTLDTFRDENSLYFERNDYFVFDVNTKYVTYKVIPTSLTLDSLYSGDIHFAEIECKQDNIDSINEKVSEGFASTTLMSNSYGYIGINAEKIPDINVRRAIMHAINAEYAVDYYYGYASRITRPMTKASWAYPAYADAFGQYYAFDNTGATSAQLVEAAGYTKNANGIYSKNGEVLKYTFTIAGNTTDHPAYQSLKRAADILNGCGFDIEVKTDINALNKLNTGNLAVWATTMDADVDPDLYQLYHIDSAESLTLWGYRAIKKNPGGKYNEELDMVKELSELIDMAKETYDQDLRAALYADALDIIMELAIQLPLYQGSNLYAYNTNVIDKNSINDMITPYSGPLSRIWEISLVG